MLRWCGKMMSLLFLIALFADCSNNEAEIMDSAYKRKQLLCKMEALKFSSDSLWNGVATFLDRNLPSDLPPNERKNMIILKNAPLIKVINSYSKLDPSIKKVVEEAGNQDYLIAEQMKLTIAQFKLADSTYFKELETQEKESPARFQNIKSKINQIEKQACDHKN